MQIKPGQILPISYKFWPQASENIVQALVTGQSDDFFELCPVHANVEAAGFFDLILRGATIESGADMVVMCRDSARFPAIALNCEKDEFDLGPMLSETEGKRVLADIKTLLAHHDGKEAYSVLRGNPLPAQSPGKELAESIRREWQSFRLATMCAAVEARKKDIPSFVGIDAFLAWAGKIVAGVLEPIRNLDKQDSLQPAFANIANVKKEKEEVDQIAVLKEKLKKESVAATKAKPELDKLLAEDDPADLLEATLRLYRKKDLRDI